MLLRKEKLGDGTKLSYEEKFGILTESIKKYLDTEDKVATLGTNDLPRTIFDSNHPAYNLFASIYANAFIGSQREEIDKILDNPIRSQIIKRVRMECLFIYGLCGESFVTTLTNNLIDGVVAMSGVSGKTALALKKELGLYFSKRPILWYCCIANSLYSAAMVESSKGIKRKLLASARSS